MAGAFEELQHNTRLKPEGWDEFVPADVINTRDSIRQLKKTFIRTVI